MVKQAIPSPHRRVTHLCLESLPPYVLACGPPFFFYFFGDLGTEDFGHRLREVFISGDLLAVSFCVLLPVAFLAYQSELAVLEGLTILVALAFTVFLYFGMKGKPAIVFSPREQIDYFRLYWYIAFSVGFSVLVVTLAFWVQRSHR